MNTASWTPGASADWAVAADWSTGAAPADPGTSATLAGSLAETVSVAASEYFGVGALSITDAQATLSLAGALSVASLSNAGTIALAGASAALLVGGALANQGTIRVANGAALWLDPGSSLANTGTITLTSSGTLGIDTSLTLASLAKVGNSGGVIDVYGDGTLNLGGKLAVSGTTGLLSGLALDGGTLWHGTLENDGGVAALYGTLNAVAWRGALVIGAQQSVSVLGGLTVATTLGAPGTITLAGGRLAVLDSETLDAMTLLSAPPSGTTNYLQNAAATDGVPSGTLTLGAGFVLSQSGGVLWLQNPTGGNGNALTVNRGRIALLGGTLRLQEGALNNVGTLALAGGALIGVESFTTFSNSGLIDASGSGGTIDFGLHTMKTNFTNLVGGVYSGGTLEADAGARLVIKSSGPMVTDNATLIFNGAGAAIAFNDQVTSAGHDIRTTLTTLNGTLVMENGAAFTFTVPLTDNGLILLSGGTLTVGTIAIAASGTLQGGGVLKVLQQGTVINNGLIAATGSLFVSGAVSGTGSLAIGAGASLEIATTESETISFNGAGLLRLDNVAPITGQITNIAAGDTIFISHARATGATLSGGTLSVALQNGSSELFHATGAPGLQVSVTQDGLGDSIVQFAAAAAHFSASSQTGLPDVAPASVATLFDEATHDGGWPSPLQHGVVP